MEFNWLAIQKNDGKITKDNDLGEFVMFDNVDLSFLPDDISLIQFDANSSNSFIQRINDGIISETKISSIDEVPNLAEITALFHQKQTEVKPPPPDNEALMAWLRGQRDELLEEADIVILRSLENGETPPSNWVTYRQELRDLPNNVESGSIPMPTFTTTGTEYYPVYTNEFSSWPVKP